MKVLITGAAGNVPTTVRKELSAYYNLRLLDVREVTNPEGEVIQGSVTDYDVVKSATQGVDAVVHMAIVSNTSPYWTDLEMNFNVNVKGTFNVCRAAWENRVKRLVYTSTGSVWACNPGYEKLLSEDGLVCSEDVEPTPGPEYPYALTKYVAEKVVEVFAKGRDNKRELKGTPSIILRLGGVVLPEKWPSISTTYRPDDLRNLVNALDIAQGIRLALENETIKFDLFNVSGGFQGTNYPIDKARRILGYNPNYVINK